MQLAESLQNVFKTESYKKKEIHDASEQMNDGIARLKC